ncbi:hypothetical protein ABKA04_009215 [Annulohypoxylon sp. FPYF3050]
MSSLSPASALTSTQAKKPPKSILKKPSARATPRAPSTTTTTTTATTTPKLDLDAPVPAAFQITEHTPSTDKKPTARDIAVQQALVIQAQRDREDQIQDTLIELSRLPLAPSTTPPPSQTYTAANPSPSDKTRFLTSIRLFQPSEYEDLITERNSLNKCGYCLCPSPRAKMSGGGSFKLLNYGRADFSIVPRAELERWCSRACARRAMYVKVQLVEHAAAPVESIRIDLLEEEDTTKAQAGAKEGNDAAQRVAKELRELEEKQKKAARDAKDLALERGEKASKLPSNLPSVTKPVTVTIREKKVTKAAQEPTPDVDEDGEDHLLLDGYKTKFDPKADPNER